jgi:hypothetical protein
MEPKKTDTGVAILEEVREIKSAVDTRITSFESDYKSDLAKLKETVEAQKNDLGVYDEDKLKGVLQEILTKQQKEGEKRLALPGGGYASTGGVKMPNFWASDPHDIIMGAKDFDPERTIKTAGDMRQAVDMIAQAPPADDNARHLQHLATDVWLLDALTKTICVSLGREYAGFKAHFPKMSNVWAKYVGAYLEQYGQKVALADIANWVPTRFTSELMELIKIQLRVAALFERFTMPASPFEWPVDLTDVVGDFVAETTGVTNPWDDTLKQEPVDEKVTFTARKLRARFLISGEAIEDAIIPLLPTLRRRLIEIQAQSEERAILDGDRAGTHMDDDVTVGTDIRKSIDGIRDFCQTNTYTVDVGSATGLDGFLTTRKNLGEHGIIPDDLAYIVSMSQYIDLLNSTEIQTVDKYGPNATILNGELARIYGIPVIVSRWVREDVATTGVNTSAGPNNKTFHLVVHRRTFMIGDLRTPTLESERLLNTDQVNIVSFRRIDFEYMYGGTAKTVAYQGTNITP